MNRSERLNYITSRMRVRQNIVAEELAAELRVSERTVYRDLRYLEEHDTLRKRYSRREGRYILEGDLALSPLRLTSAEAAALGNAAASAALCRESMLAANLTSALTKLYAASSESMDTPESSALVALAENAQQPIIEEVRQAIRCNRKIKIDYWQGSGTPVSLCLAPVELRSHCGSWYLIARAGGNASVQAVPIRRVSSVVILQDRFRLCRRSETEQQIEQILAAAEMSSGDTQLALRFSAAAASTVKEAPYRRFVSVELQPDGSILCVVLVPRGADVVWWLLSYGAQVEVIAPAEVRDTVAREAAAVCAIYRERSQE